MVAHNIGCCSLLRRYTKSFCTQIMKLKQQNYDVVVQIQRGTNTGLPAQVSRRCLFVVLLLTAEAEFGNSV